MRHQTNSKNSVSNMISAISRSAVVALMTIILSYSASITLAADSAEKISSDQKTVEMHLEAAKVAVKRSLFEIAQQEISSCQEFSSSLTPGQKQAIAQLQESIDAGTKPAVEVATETVKAEVEEVKAPEVAVETAAQEEVKAEVKETVKPEVKKSGSWNIFKRSKKLTEDELKQINYLLARATQAHLAGKYAQAIELYDDVLEIDPENQKATEGKASEIYNLSIQKKVVAEKDKPSAIDEFIAKQNVQVQQIESYWQTTKIVSADYVKAGKYDDAISAITKAIVNFDGHKQTLGNEKYVMLSNEANKTLDLVKNKQAKAESMRIDQQRQNALKIQLEAEAEIQGNRDAKVNSLLNRSREFTRLGQYDSAIATLETLLEIDPTNAHALHEKDTLVDIRFKDRQIQARKTGLRNEADALAGARDAANPPAEGKIVVYPDNFEQMTKNRIPKDTTAESLKRQTNTLERLDTTLVELYYDGEALDYVLSDIADKSSPNENERITIFAKWPKIRNEANIEQDARVTIPQTTVPISQALDMVLSYVSGEADAKLGYEVNEFGLVEVSIASKTYGYTFETYYVADLTQSSQSMGGGGMGGMGGGMGGYGGNSRNSGMGGNSRNGGSSRSSSRNSGFGGSSRNSGRNSGGFGGGYGRYEVPEYYNDNGNPYSNPMEPVNVPTSYTQPAGRVQNTQFGMGGGMMGGRGGMGGGMMGGRGGMMGGMGGGMMGGRGGMMGGMGGMMGGMGGQANIYEQYQLQDLIMSTIAPETWLYGNNNFGNNRLGQQGGVGAGALGAAGNAQNLGSMDQPQGEIKFYGTTIMGVFQIPEVHRQIDTLLKQLRATRGDLVSIEARLLQISSNFLEDIGMDVDFLINSNAVGYDNLSDITVNQNTLDFTSPPSVTSVPGTLGGGALAEAFQVSGSFLDNVQVDFLIKATHAHKRNKALTAPHVTVFNGEYAEISFNTIRPYVASVTAVTDYGVGLYEPEIEEDESGISLSVSPVITADKRYVQLAVNFEQNLTREMVSFTYATGTDNTNTTTTGINPQNTQSVTIQQPITDENFIQTYVKVPDGGTLLLGGQKLVGESEKEAGVPGLSTIPILSRLFSNRSIVKDENILLILLKPQIILQDEAEAEVLGSLDQTVGMNN
ncbi:MAG: hypothetical protein JEZ07_10930 [Phycisphaerae bacterium]|nr:hypothetical protein [Phycisphaerae bacterium]